MKGGKDVQLQRGEEHGRTVERACEVDDLGDIQSHNVSPSPPPGALRQTPTGRVLAEPGIRLGTEVEEGVGSDRFAHTLHKA